MSAAFHMPLFRTQLEHDQPPSARKPGLFPRAESATLAGDPPAPDRYSRSRVQSETDRSTQRRAASGATVLLLILVVAGLSGAGTLAALQSGRSQDHAATTHRPQTAKTSRDGERALRLSQAQQRIRPAAHAIHSLRDFARVNALPEASAAAPRNLPPRSATVRLALLNLPPPVLA
jgi:hypothetical protein